MWVIVTMGYDGPNKVLGVFNNPDVAHLWAVDNGHNGNAWIMKVERPDIADLFLIELKET